MRIIDIIKSLLSETKDIDIKKLPSQGFFYKPDFGIKIKKADMEDIIEYEHRFDKDNLMLALDCIKNIVKNNVMLNKEYSYVDIKSVDIIFIFLEIVKFTRKSEIKIPYTNIMSGSEEFINFGPDSFNYFNFNKFSKYFDEVERDMTIDGYKFSLPSIGVEASLTSYLATKTDPIEIKRLNESSYDFMFFLGSKNGLSATEIENLIHIFNHDLDSSELDKISNIIDKFKGIVGYSLMVDGSPIEIKTKVNLQDIWKIK